MTLRPFLLLLLAVLAGASSSLAAGGSHARRPNILFILADDLGYGDLRSYNPRSRIDTPHLDRLAREGVRFTDAHAGGSWCVPSRYSLLTGHSPFRVPNTPDVGPVIAHGRQTVAGMLRERGYRTGMIGKWHLGFERGIKFDYARPLRGGPVDRGFDSFFGIHASTDIPPYFYIEGDRVVAAPTERIEARHSEGWSPIQGEFWRAGPIAPGLQLEDVHPEFTRRSVRWLEEQHRANPRQPFFLYVALASPHTPWLPTGRFKGSSEIGMYGDFTREVDDTVGQLLAALDRLGIADDTIVFFGSDNGPVWYPADTLRLGHDSAAGLRGIKGDAWEGGHRVPLLARWPGSFPAGSTVATPVCFTDFFATAAEIVGAELPRDAAEDSFSMLRAMAGRESAPRPAMVTMSYRDVLRLAVREGDWKLIDGLGSGGFTEPVFQKPVPDGPHGQLYNLKDDPQEQNNLWLAEPERVARLLAVLERQRREGRSRP
jgi:arylsulfatase A